MSEVGALCLHRRRNSNLKKETVLRTELCDGHCAYGALCYVPCVCEEVMLRTSGIAGSYVTYVVNRGTHATYLVYMGSHVTCLVHHGSYFTYLVYMWRLCYVP